MLVSALNHQPTTATGVGREVMLLRTVQMDPSQPAIGVTPWDILPGSAIETGRWGTLRILGPMHTVIGVRKKVIIPDYVL